MMNIKNSVSCFSSIEEYKKRCFLLDFTDECYLFGKPSVSHPILSLSHLGCLLGVK